MKNLKKFTFTYQGETYEFDITKLNSSLQFGNYNITTSSFVNPDLTEFPWAIISGSYGITFTEAPLTNLGVSDLNFNLEVALVSSSIGGLNGKQNFLQTLIASNGKRYCRLGTYSTEDVLSWSSWSKAYIEGGGGSSVLTSDIIVFGTTFGKYTSGQTIPSTGWTFEEFLQDVAFNILPPTGSISAAGTIPYNSTTGSLNLTISASANTPDTTITSIKISVKRGSGSYSEIYNGVFISTYSHNIASLLVSDNVLSFQYKLDITDSNGSTYFTTSNTITPTVYAPPTTSISVSGTRELGNISTLISGTVSQNTQNGVSITERKLQYSLDNSSWVDITTFPSNTISYTHNDNALLNSTVIYYRLLVSCNTATGTQVTTLALGSISYVYKQVFGYSSNTNPDLATLLAFTNSSLTNSKTKTVTATAPSGNYTYFAYKASSGDLSGIIMDGVTPVLGAFTKLGDISGVNSYGATVTYRVYKSNAPAAFTNNSLVIS